MLADAQISSLGYLWLVYDQRRGEGRGSLGAWWGCSSFRTRRDGNCSLCSHWGCSGRTTKLQINLVPRAFPSKNRWGPQPFFEGKALGTRLIEDVSSMRCRRFRAVSEQRTMKESQRPREKWLSSHFSCGQNRQSRSSVYLCSETKRTRLLHRLRCMSHGGCSEQKSNVYFPYRYRFVLKEISIQKTNAVIQCWSMVFLF